MASEDPIFYVRVTPPGSSIQVDATERVTSFSYEDDEGKSDKLTLTIDNYDLTQLDEPVWRPGAVVEVSWGYPGNMAPARSCSIQKVKGSMVLNIECLDAASAKLNKVQKVRTFERMKRSDVARTLATESGVETTRQFIDDTEEVLEQITQARMTDHQLLVDMAKREGFEFYVDFDGFHWHKRRLGQKPLRRFTFFIDSDRSDILAWNIENDIFAGGSGKGGMTAKGRDLKTKTNFTATADNVSEAGRQGLAPTTELVVGISARDGSVLSVGSEVTGVGGTSTNAAAAGSAVMPAGEGTAASTQRAVSGAFSKAQMTALELTVEAIGDPNVLAKSVVEMAGIGKSVSGNYFVKNVTHKLGDGYRMSMKLKRDGKNTGAGASATGQATTGVITKGAVNNKTPPPNGAGATELVPVVKVLPNGQHEVSYVESRGREN